MKSRRQKVREDRRIIARYNELLKTSMDEGENSESEPILTDLLIEVFLRLPVKSIARIRCLSKRWDSLLVRPYFTELFLTRSSFCPKLLFACANKNNELQLFSSPQPQNPDENSSTVTANYHMSFPFKRGNTSEYVRPVHGLICLKHVPFFEQEMEIVIEICNPSTGHSLTSPKVKIRRARVSSFPGYDEIEKQFKVLFSSSSGYHSLPAYVEYRILTLGRGKLSWRKIECSIPNYPLSDSICINGVLYYLAGGLREDDLDDGIVCFDIKSEKFKFIKAANVWEVKLVNYMGKLATLKSDDQDGERICGTSTSFELAILVDAEKHEWSNHSYVLPSTWKDIVGDDELLSCVGVTRTGEVVLSSYYLVNGFYLVYYNLERNTLTKVEVKGIDASQCYKVSTILDHVEDVKLWGIV